jgi:hypothetical protein
LFSVWAALKSHTGAGVSRDRTVSILFGIALLLMPLYITAATRIALYGMAYIGLAKAALLLTASFAVAGAVCGLMRGLPSGRTLTTSRP